MAFAAFPLSGTSTAAPWTMAPRFARGLVLSATVAAAVAGALYTEPVAAARALANAGPDLTRLLRAMAAIKAAMALAVLAAVSWRLASPAGPARLAAYALACAAMAAGPGLIWDMAHLVAGAGLLHAGLIAALVLLWRDPAVGARLERDVFRRNRSKSESSPDSST